MTKGACPTKQCLFPKPCKNLEVDHKDYIALLKKLRVLPGVKKVFIRSGIRFDYLMYDKDRTFLRELCEHHVSGQLKVAPEHISNTVLQKLGKPSVEVYNSFVKAYKDMNKNVGADKDKFTISCYGIELPFEWYSMEYILKELGNSKLYLLKHYRIA